MVIRSKQKLLVFALGLSSGISYAQTEENADIEEEIVETSSIVAEDDGAPEKINVVGSRIKRIDIESSSPVQIIDREQIEASGVVSLGELFRRNAGTSPTGNFAGTSGFVSSGASTIDLLGLGASRTLVLLNGKRLPVTAGLNAVNVDNIPVALIQSVEILSGGASAIYGADAVGGVVNIQLRKELDGSEIAAFSTFPSQPGGEELEVSLSNGGQITDSINYIGSIGFRTRRPLDKRNRDLLYNEPGKEYTVTNPPAGTWSYRPISQTDSGFDIGDWTPSANCPNGNQIATVPSEPNNRYCAGLREEVENELIPEKDEIFGTLGLNWDIGPTMTASLLYNYHRSENTVNDGPFIVYSQNPISRSPMILSREQAINTGVVGADATEDFFQVYAPVPEQPFRQYINTNTTESAIASLDGDFGTSGWSYNSTLSWATARAERRGEGIFSRNAVGDLFTNPETSLGQDPAYNPLDPNRDTAAFLDTFETLESYSLNKTITGDFFASTELMQLPGGPLGFGIGTGFMVEDFKQVPDARDVIDDETQAPVYTGTFADRGEGDRTVGSAFSEAYLPVHKDVLVEAALRYDNFSDFGNALNYGLGVKWEVLEGLALRTRTATSFRAPPLTFLHQLGGGGYRTINDDRYCDREREQNRVCNPDTPARQVYVDSPGNEDLDPEEGVNFISGLIYEPMQGLVFMGDYFDVTLEKTFQTDDVQEIADRWYRESGDNTTGGTVSGNPVGVDEDGIITTIGTPVRNLGRTEVHAAQLRAEYNTQLGDFRLGLQSLYFRMISYKVQENQDTDIRQVKGFFGIPEWRHNHNFTLGYDIHTLNLRALVIGGQSQDPLTANPRTLGTSVPEHKEYDLSYVARMPWNGTLQVGVNNILNDIGGVTNANAIGSENIVTTSLYSPIGRSFFARITQRF